MATQSQPSSPSSSRSSTDRSCAAARALVAGLISAGLVLGPACGGDDDDGSDGADDAADGDAAPDGGDAECGPGDAPPDGITVGAGDEEASAVFGQFRSSANNDCPPEGGQGPTSLTIQAAQTDPDDPTRFLVLCLPRPDQIDDAPIPLDDSDRVQLVDLLAAPADGCRLELDRDRAPSGDITFSGFCDDGVHADGYAVEFAATAPLLRTCGEDPAEPIDADLGGRVAVVAGSL